MLSNRRMGMVGFVEHSAYGLVFLAFFVFIGLPFALKGSTHWGISFLIYMMTFGNIMYLSASLSAYGKSMLTDSNFDVDIGEMYDILSNAKIFKIIFMIIPLSILGVLLSPFALITMLLNIKTFFKRNEEYLDAVDEEWERREPIWNSETQEMEKKAKDRTIQKKEERFLAKEEFRKREFEEKVQEKLAAKENSEKKSIETEIVAPKEKKVGYVKFSIGDSSAYIYISNNGLNYISSFGVWRKKYITNSFDDMVNEIRNFYKNNKDFRILEIKKN